ncbi:MAG: response regulator [Alphaproteobacteria bacterium]
MRAYSIENLKFLIIDPNKHMQFLFKTVLRALGARDFESSDNSVAAVSLLNSFRPDIVITELVTTPMDGIEFTKVVRRGKEIQNPFVPIIMATAMAEARVVVMARDSGITEFLVKPISATSLYRRIHSIIDTPRDFVRTAEYFGPDRRRHQTEISPKRREADRLAAEAAAREAMEALRVQAEADVARELAVQKAKAQAERNRQLAAQADAEAARAKQLAAQAEAASAREQAERAALSQAEVAAMLAKNASKK